MDKKIINAVANGILYKTALDDVDKFTHEDMENFVKATLTECEAIMNRVDLSDMRKSDLVYMMKDLNTILYNVYVNMLESTIDYEIACNNIADRLMRGKEEI